MRQTSKPNKASCKEVGLTDNSQPVKMEQDVMEEQEEQEVIYGMPQENKVKKKKKKAIKPAIKVLGRRGERWWW
jgi:hypothetical protein